ncbi:MAG: hypothetical protein AAGD35_23695 [Actinomycetota bacterium]
MLEDRSHRPRVRWATRLLLLATLSLVAGCSRLDAPHVLQLVETEEGVVALIGEMSVVSADAVAVSRDQGRTWSRTVPERVRIDIDDLNRRMVGAEDGPPTSDEACIEDRCFRTVRGEEVQERIDGEWVTAWRFGGEERRRLELRYGDGAFSGPWRYQAELFNDIAVAPGADDRAPTVVVSLGAEGVLRLDPTTDTWERAVVPGVAPVNLSWPSLFARAHFLLIAMAVAAPAIGLFAGEDSRRQRVGLTVGMGALLFGAGVITWFLVILGLNGASYPLYGVLVLLLAAAVGGAGYLMARSARPRPSSVPAPPAPTP